MSGVRFVLITAMRAQGMSWREIAQEFGVKSPDGFARTYNMVRQARANAAIVKVLRRAAK